jgi:hypothetical protein
VAFQDRLQTVGYPLFFVDDQMTRMAEIFNQV